MVSRSIARMLAVSATNVQAASLRRKLMMSEECATCGGEGLVDFTDEEWIAKYGVTLSEYQMTGKEEETMKECTSCNGSGCVARMMGLNPTEGT